jgi:type VI protein secretion system component Hcp
MDKVFVASYRTGSSDPDTPIDEVSFAFNEVRVAYSVLGGDESFASAGWNLRTKQPI